MTYGTMEKIETVTVTAAGGQASIEFLNIPQTYDDLVIKISGRGTTASIERNVFFSFNGVTTNRSCLFIEGAGSGTPTSTTLSVLYAGAMPAASSTASTFSSNEIYIPNYRSSSNKSSSADGTMENNATTSYINLIANLWSSTAAITQVTLTPDSGNFAQYSSATLYGITRVPAGAKATGGVIYDDASYWYHVFTSSGTFTPSTSLTADVLVVAGGGSGGSAAGGGGGAGGLCFQSGRSITAGNYTVTIGGGGARTTSDGANGNAGSNSIFDTITALGGAGGAHSANGASGGSGGGSGYNIGSSGGSATQGTSGGATGYGNAGGANNRSGSGAPYPCGGGGGAGGAGGVATESAGGVGGIGLGGNVLAALNEFGAATNTGQLSGGNYYFAGGGGGSRDTTIAAGGLGGGGRGGTVLSGGTSVAPIAGTINTGGGGGGGIASGTYNGGPDNGGVAGGSGIVIVRYAK